MVSTMIDLMPGETPTPMQREVVQTTEKDKTEAAQERQGAFVFIMAAEARRAHAANRTPEQERDMAPAERSLAGLGKFLASPATTEAVNPTPVKTREQAKLEKKNPPRIRIKGSTLTPIPGGDLDDGPSNLGDGEHEVTTFHNRTPDGKINLTVKDKDGKDSLITVDEATFVEMYMLGCKADFDSLRGQSGISTGSFLNKENVKVVMEEFVEKNGDWTQMTDVATAAVKGAKTEVVHEMPIIHGFTPAAVGEAGARVAELQTAADQGKKIDELTAEVALATKNKSGAEQALASENDAGKKEELKKALEAATTAEKKAKDALASRELQEKALADAKGIHNKLKAGSADLAKDPPSDEALTTHINTLIEGDVQAKVNTLQGEILGLKGEIRELLANNLDGAKDKANALQKQLDAKQAEINNYKLMTEHPEMTAAFVRQMQRGEVSKDVVDKIQKALDQGNASDLVKEFSSEAFKDKLEELKKKIDMSKDPKMKDFFEKYRPYLVTGGIAVFLLYQIIIQAMNKEDRNGGH